MRAWEWLGEVDPVNGFAYPYCQNSRKFQHLFKFKDADGGFEAWEKVCETVAEPDIADRATSWLVANIKKVTKLSAEKVDRFFSEDMEKEEAQGQTEIDDSLQDPEEIGTTVSAFDDFLRGRTGVSASWLERMFNVLAKHDKHLAKFTPGQKEFLFGYWRLRVKYERLQVTYFVPLDKHFEYLDRAIDLEGETVQQALAHVKKMFRESADAKAAGDPHRVTNPFCMSNVISTLNKVGILHGSALS